MYKLVAAALSVPLIACAVDAGSGVDDTTGVSGHVAASTTWSDTVTVTGPITVDPGVVLTIAPGTTVRLAAGTSITVRGSALAQGRKDAPVTIVPTASGDHHNGFAIPSGGAVEMSYVVQVGGGFSVEGGTLTVTDTFMSRAGGDLLVVSAGRVDMSYSQIGLEPGTGNDTTHCDAHFGGSGISIAITHSNLSTSAYGLMLYGGTGVDLTHDNWFANDIDIDTSPGVMADISGGWFAKGAPVAGSGATLVANTAADKRLPDAGPR